MAKSTVTGGFDDLVEAAARIAAAAPDGKLPKTFYAILGRAIEMRGGLDEIDERLPPGTSVAPKTDAVLDQIFDRAKALRVENTMTVAGAVADAVMAKAAARLAAPPDEMTVQEAAMAVGRSEQTIMNWIEKNPQLGRFDKASRRYWVSRSALIEFWTKRFGAETLPAALVS